MTKYMGIKPKATLLRRTGQFVTRVLRYFIKRQAQSITESTAETAGPSMGLHLSMPISFKK